MSNIFTNYYSKNNITFINYSTGEVSPTLTKALISSFKDFKFKFNYYKIKPHYANYASTKFFIFTKVLNFLQQLHY